MFKNVKIGKKLIIAFIALGLVVSIAGFVGLGLMVNLDKSYSDALVTNGFVQGDIGDFNAYLNRGAAMTRDVIMLTNPVDIQSAQAELKDASEKAVAALEAARANCQSPEELKILAKIDAASPKYTEARERAVALGLQNKNDEALQVFRNDAKPYLNECVTAGQELMALNVTMGNAASANLSAQSAFGVVIIIVVITAGLVIATILGIFIARDISKPLGEIEKVAEKMAAGDFDVDIKYNSRNEIGALANSMRQMTTVTKEIILDTSRGLGEIAAGNFDITPKANYVGVFAGIRDAMAKIITDMSETMGQIKMSAEQVTSGSEQVSSGAQALAQGATEQASSVEELSASINEVTQQVKDNAENASAAQRVVSTVDNSIRTSNEQMTHMIGAMSEISSSSQEIAKIIKTIEDIAFQTNILALNAAVEAARAGAAGKGFAVVADEVRNLATKSSEAAKQTGALIENSVKSVANGVAIADETAKSLSSVVEGAHEITSLIERISNASAEQSTSISQINLGVEQISSVVQTNSATSEESAAASEELNGQANMMNGMVSRFKLKGSAKEEVLC